MQLVIIKQSMGVVLIIKQWWISGDWQIDEVVYILSLFFSSISKSPDEQFFWEKKKTLS